MEVRINGETVEREDMTSNPQQTQREMPNIVTRITEHSILFEALGCFKSARSLNQVAIDLEQLQAAQQQAVPMPSLEVQAKAMVAECDYSEEVDGFYLGIRWLLQWQTEQRSHNTEIKKL